jgi:hypothetical protein
MGWIFLVVSVSAIIIYALLTDHWSGAILGLSAGVGFFVGDYLMREALVLAILLIWGPLSI